MQSFTLVSSLNKEEPFTSILLDWPFLYYFEKMRVGEKTLACKFFSPCLKTANLLKVSKNLVFSSLLFSRKTAQKRLCLARVVWIFSVHKNGG